MSSNNFSFSIKDYFKTLHHKFGEGPLHIMKEEPWFFKLGIKLFTFFHPDQAVKRYRESSWHELRTLYSLQMARSKLAMSEKNQRSHFQSACGDDPDSRGFGQLPCTIKSIHARVAAINKAISKESPILIIGDDDALSVALAEDGFKDITVFEIDVNVVNKLNVVFEKFNNIKYKIIEQDVFQPVPEEVKKEFALITFDPWYAIDGFKAFLECGLNASKGSRPQILLSFNCGALLSDLKQLGFYLEEKDYTVTKWIPLSNTYPMPKGLHVTLELAEFLVGVLTLKFFNPFNKNKKLFFSSDLLLLTKA